MKGIKFVLGTLLFILLACAGDKSETKAPASSKSDAQTEEPASTSTASTTKKAASTTTNRKGRLVYKQYCVVCHGADGKLNVSGAKDLSISTISFEERINQITNGKGLMTPYKYILSEEQINSVAEYIEELKQ